MSFMPSKVRRVSFPRVLVLLMGLCTAATLAIQGATPLFAETQVQTPVPAQAASSPLTATIVYQENSELSNRLNMPVYQWQQGRQTGTAPRGIILAVHGLAMHGRRFDYLGKALAERGFLVVATDLHGYGSYLYSQHQYCRQADCKQKINYESSYDDIVKLARALKKSYPSLPLFGIGESLGSDIVIRLAAQNPELVDGLILSAPAIKRRSFMDPYLIADASLILANPRHQLDLTRFVYKYSSDDPRIAQEVVDDPMTRHHLSAYELLQACQTVHKTISYVPAIPADMPVLVIQGSADKCVKAGAVMLLLSQLRSSDQTVKWFHQRGHILIETAYMKPDTMAAVTSWLDSHVSCPIVQAKCNHLASGYQKTASYQE